MDLDTFLQFAQEYNDLGWSVQDQMKDVAEGVPAEQMNPNALRIIKTFLKNLGDCGVTGTGWLLEAIEEGIEDEDGS